MRYTVWSRGRELGETDLGFAFRYNGMRCGWFHTTELGDRLMPMATAVSPALRTVYTVGRDPTVCADLCSAIDQEEALALELRSPDGALIATEEIAIIDTHYLLSLAECDLRENDTLDAEQESEIEAVESWSAENPLETESIEWSPADESDFPRYQIQVHLIDRDSVP
jgi:hypothetical protein